MTGDTVQNWIRSGILPAQRTAGGQYRVRTEDVRQFMTERDMSVEDLDRDLREERPEYCWQYHCKRVRRHTGKRDVCDNCVVKRTLTLRCYDLREHVDHGRVHCGTDCSECGYYRKYAQPTDQ